MKYLLRTLMALLVPVLLWSSVEVSNAEGTTVAVDQEAANFALFDTYGVEHVLDGYRGRYIVLEWLNHDCPFVRKHYNSGNMQALQKRYAEQGVVWLSIVSSARGKQGYFEPDEANALTAEKGAEPTAVLIDASGDVGRLYGARTTPQMVVIDTNFQVIYAGAIDDRPSTKVEDIDGARNFVVEALDAAMAGREVEVKTRQSYGCSVKY